MIQTWKGCWSYSIIVFLRGCQPVFLCFSAKADPHGVSLFPLPALTAPHEDKSRISINLVFTISAWTCDSNTWHNGFSNRFQLLLGTFPVDVPSIFRFFSKTIHKNSTDDVCVHLCTSIYRLKVRRELGAEGVGLVCVLRVVIGCSGPCRSLPELIICTDLIDNRALQSQRKCYSQLPPWRSTNASTLALLSNYPVEVAQTSSGQKKSSSGGHVRLCSPSVAWQQRIWWHANSNPAWTKTSLNANLNISSHA